LKRRKIVAAVRHGTPMRVVARRFKVHLRTVQRWVKRASGTRLDQADLSSRRPGARESARRVKTALEARVLSLRVQLRDESALGEYGAAAIRRSLLEEGTCVVPTERTIHRVLERHGVLDGIRRMRFLPPPRGWYLPTVASGRAELDSFDLVEGLVIRGGTDVVILNGMSLLGGLCASWPMCRITAKEVVEKLLEHWRCFGLPGYAQFDNGTEFQGAHQWPDSFGRVTRTCLSLGVTPVFAPPRETGFQASIENYNGRWQSKVWSRFEHADLAGLRVRSDAFVAAARTRSAARIESAPSRRKIDSKWKPDLQRPLSGTVIFLRRTDGNGRASLLGRSFEVSIDWPNRLVRAEVDLMCGRVRFFKLRRRDHANHPLLKEIKYETPTKRFNE
jgi:transposase